MSAFKKGDLVRWASAYVEQVRKRGIDPRWYRERRDDVGTVDWIQANGDVIVAWHDHNGIPMTWDTCVHVPNRIELVPKVPDVRATTKLARLDENRMARGRTEIVIAVNLGKCCRMTATPNNFHVRCEVS